MANPSTTKPSRKPSMRQKFRDSFRTILDGGGVQKQHADGSSKRTSLDIPEEGSWIGRKRRKNRAAAKEEEIRVGLGDLKIETGGFETGLVGFGESESDVDKFGLRSAGTVTTMAVTSREEGMRGLERMGGVAGSGGGKGEAMEGVLMGNGRAGEYVRRGSMRDSMRRELQWFCGRRNNS